MLKIFRIIPIVVILLCLLACTFSPSVYFFTQNKEMIVFAVQPDGEDSEIFSYDIASGDFTQLTDNLFEDIKPIYNQSTERITFFSDRGSNWNLWEMDVTGKRVTKLTREQDLSLDLFDWSADGKFLIASILEKCDDLYEGCNYNLVTISNNGKEWTNLTDSDFDKYEPDWSPDGTSIAFSGFDEEFGHIYVADYDGTNVKQLTNEDFDDYTPRWSPDGTKIAFVSNRDGPDWDIFLMNSDGSNIVQLTTNGTDDLSPCWSPDGTRLIYNAFVNDNFELIIIDSNGQNQFRLTNNEIDESSPIWFGQLNDFEFFPTQNQTNPDLES